jgi:hypothetical protein
MWDLMGKVEWRGFLMGGGGKFSPANERRSFEQEAAERTEERPSLHFWETANGREETRIETGKRSQPGRRGKYRVRAGGEGCCFPLKFSWRFHLSLWPLGDVRNSCAAFLAGGRSNAEFRMQNAE